MSAQENLNQQQFMYHATSPRNRNSIAEHGLLTDMSLDEDSWKSVYMSERPSKDQDSDVWRVDVTGYRTDPDPGGVGGSYFVDHDIPQDRLTLHQKGRGNKWIGYPPK